MHELSIAEALLHELAEVASKEGAQRVVGLTIAVGSLSGVDPEALNLVFPLAAENTVAEGATLRIDRVVAEAECSACGRRFEPDFPFFVCESCESANVKVTAGRELLITRVDLDMPESHTPAG